MRRFLIILVVVLVALVAIDRVAALVVAKQIAVRAKQSEGLTSEPKVHIGGFPFLTQVIVGKYDNVKVTIHDVTRDNLTVHTIDAHLIGTHLPLSQILRGNVKRVPVDRGAGSVVLTYADMNAYLQTQRLPARVSADGDTLRISGDVELLGRQIPLSGTARLGVAKDTITLTPTVVSQVAGILPASLQAAAVNALTVHLQVQGLPFGVHLQSATVQKTALRFDAVGSAVVLDNTATTP
jgi:LmeA-like phospholipid-binding